MPARFQERNSEDAGLQAFLDAQSGDGLVPEQPVERALLITEVIDLGVYSDTRENTPSALSVGRLIAFLKNWGN